MFCTMTMCMLKGNATRWCTENGTWHSKPDYSQCLDWPQIQSVKYVLVLVTRALILTVIAIRLN